MQPWIHKTNHIIGKSHIPKNIPCQDYTNSFQDDKFNIIALSDGCGSSKYSDIGSKIVVDTLIELLISQFDYIASLAPLESRLFILNSINANLELKANSYNEDIKEFNATLLFVAIKEDRDLLMGHLGDGYIGAVNNSVLEIKSLEKKDEEVNGTVYTTSQNAHLSFDLRKGQLKDYQGFILMSDGSGEALVDSRVPFEKKFINSVAGVFEFVGSNTMETSDTKIKEYITKIRDHIQSGDDCSLAFLIKKDIKISSINTYQVPKPVVKKVTENTPIYVFNQRYEEMFQYITNTFNSVHIKMFDKINFSKYMDDILLNKKSIELNSSIDFNVLEQHIKHLLYDGYLYEN